MWINIEQNTDEWLNSRLGKASASNAAKWMANYGKAFGEPANKYALQIALERITGKSSGENYINAHMERGHEQEPIARKLYEEAHFIEVTNGGMFDCGLYSSSPDGLIGDDGVIEIKSVIASTQFKTLQRDSFDPAYLWQLLSHLDCSQRDWVDYVSYCSDFPEHLQLLVYRLYAWDYTDKITMLRDRRKEFLSLVDKIEGQLK